MFLFFGNVLFASKPIYISLGSSCEPALRLRDLHIRVEAFPFDWILSPFHGVYNAINEDFSNFFCNLQLVSAGTAVCDHYSIAFHHDFRPTVPSHIALTTVDWKAMLPEIRSKYKRRIERFRTACNSNRDVIFIRYGKINKSQALLLKNLIKKKFPHLSFILMVVEPAQSFENPWNIPNIRNFSINYFEIKKWGLALNQVGSEFKRLKNP